MGSEGIVQSVYKVVTRSSSGVTRRNDVSGGKWIFCYCVIRLHTNLGQFLLMDRGVSPNVYNREFSN